MSSYALFRIILDGIRYCLSVKLDETDMNHLADDIIERLKRDILVVKEFVEEREE